MSELATLIEDMLVQVPEGRMGIIFNGKLPELIGTIAETDDMALIRRVVDTLLIERRLSAEKISLAQMAGSAIVFIMAHG